MEGVLQDKLKWLWKCSDYSTCQPKKLMYVVYMYYNTYNAVIGNLPHFKK